MLETTAMRLRVGDRVAKAGCTGAHEPTVFEVAEVDGCGRGADVRVWLRLVGTDGFGRRVEVVERLPLEAVVYRV
jgi:hypothetical protein